MTMAMPGQVIRQTYSPPSSPPRVTSAKVLRTGSPVKSPARARSASRPKQVEVKDLEEKFKELQQQRKKDDAEHREQERNSRRLEVSNHQNLMRQQRQAE